MKATIRDLDLPTKCFDAVALVDVIERLPGDEALDVLAYAEKWAHRKVTVASPDGFVAQGAADGNLLQVHLSDWELRRLRALGFNSVGLAGLKVFQQDVHADTMADGLSVSVRFRPTALWFVIVSLSKILTYHMPLLAFWSL